MSAVKDFCFNLCLEFWPFVQFISPSLPKRGYDSIEEMYKCIGNQRSTNQGVQKAQQYNFEELSDIYCNQCSC